MRNFPEQLSEVNFLFYLAIKVQSSEINIHVITDRPQTKHSFTEKINNRKNKLNAATNDHEPHQSICKHIHNHANIATTSPTSTTTRSTCTWIIIDNNSSMSISVHYCIRLFNNSPFWVKDDTPQRPKHNKEASK